MIIGAKVHAAQAEVVTSDCKTTIAAAGIRGGKTEAGALRHLLFAQRLPTAHDQCHAITSPTFPMSVWGPEAKLHKLLAEVFPPWFLAHYAKSTRTFYVRNGLGTLSKLRIFTGEKPDRWRGDAWLTWWNDEAAYLTDDAFRVGQGRLMDTDGEATLTTSPNGINHVAKLAERATVVIPRPGFSLRESPDRRTRLVSWSSHFNPFLEASAEAAIEEMRRDYDPDFFAQEIEAAFVARSGRVYRVFDRAIHVGERPLSQESIVRVWVGQDFNVERMCSAFTVEFDFGPFGRGLYLFDEMEIRNADTHMLVRRLDEWCQRWRIPKHLLAIVPDASGRKRQTAGSKAGARSDHEILIRAGYAVKGPKANPPVKDRVNSLAGLIFHARFIAHPRCKLTIEALENQRWGENGAPEKDGVYDNRTDALGYAAWWRFPLRKARARLHPGGSA